MATKTIAWNDGSGEYITLTYMGQGNGSIQVSSPENSGATRSKSIVVKTTNGGLVVKNITVSQAAAPIQVGDIIDFDYTGTVQSVVLPKGQYKLQCWGAQGGSVSGLYTASGSKGGYSEGVLTLSQKTTVYIFVGGKGTDIETTDITSGIVNGGWNGGGGSVKRIGNSVASYGYTYGESYPRGGGGGTDIALTTSPMPYSANGVTNRSAASLLSRLIVAGGGGGACANYYEYPDQETQITATINGSSYTADTYAITYSTKKWNSSTGGAYAGHLIDVTNHRGESCTFTGGSAGMTFIKSAPVANSLVDYASGYGSTGYNDASGTVTVPSDAVYLWIQCNGNDTSGSRKPSKIQFSKIISVTRTGQYSSLGNAFGGGQTAGGNTNPGKQNTGYAFGVGEVRVDNNSKFASGGGGGGWYGGSTNSNIQYPHLYVELNDGGSGFVNTAASADNRPSGYTGLELDSGSTTAGDQSFEAPGGGTETGHEGNGYARITRLA